MGMKAFGAGAAIATLLAAGAQAVTIKDAVVTVSPTEFSGACPHVFTFTATITLEGMVPPAAGPPPVVTYKWERSDGAIDTAVHPPMPATPGAHVVTTTWTLGAATPTLQPFNGWEKIRVWLGNTVKVSDPATVKLTCVQQKKPDLEIYMCPMNGWIEVRNHGPAPAGPSKALITCSKLGESGSTSPGGGCPQPPVAGLLPPWSLDPAGVVLSVPHLPTSGALVEFMPWWPALVWKPGTYQFKAIADYTNAVAESNEGNNTATCTLTKP